jgi:hypothetical protein
MSTTYRAAWVPDDDPHRPWDDAAALAVEWIEARIVAAATTLTPHGTACHRS